MPSSASAPASPTSASHSQNSATQPSPRKNLAEAANSNDAEEKKPDLTDQFEDFYNFNSIEKYQKYEADYAQRLMAKYFSKKNLYGGNIFEENTTVDNEIIKSSKWPCTRSFADPLQGFEDHRSSCSTSAMESHSAISNGKHAVKKNG
ncbi:uncharacterized protein E5676_scaffold346G00180 [Cucumis melo var. makuwa]|uniref:Uncharacterized protein n=1 Tax=Cucumis melo var. makuwa TaxID=1194695 RepID=A0A5D3BGU2_CUCMM|nr:uncharacterized protein E6C27_scaffold274G003280 [Cucumis melo var. makuwa]TYJ98246.1 uncharacterized protein E5676_scaffold346G00180 [Cucumis melo var. makuwa]